MPLRYLFGPIPAGFAHDCLARQRQAGLCLTFGAPGTDLPIAATDSFETLGVRLPSGWQPDFLAWYLPYTTAPAWLEAGPWPRIGLAADWNLLWHHYRQRLSQCDLILTDTAG